jgi:NADH-quinone oxidoreductase subunit J
VLAALVPARNLPAALWLSIVLLLSSACLLWSFGLELLGWLVLVVYLGALAILFLFVVMLLDLGVFLPTIAAPALHVAWSLVPWSS